MGEDRVVAASRAGLGTLRLLVVAGSYPYPARNWTGIFTERCVDVLKDVCEHVEVLVPRPYLPAVMSRIKPRWGIYRQIASKETRNGVEVRRPPYIQVPAFAGSSSVERGKFWSCRGLVRRMHRRAPFDAILAFDLLAAGGLAWRIGRALGVPAAAWALGSDVRVAAGSPRGRTVAETLRRLDLVLYQSRELKAAAAGLVGESTGALAPDRHVVLPHGIPAPPDLDRERCRIQARTAWGVSKDDIVVLYLGRILRSKGSVELLGGFSAAAALDQRLVCVCIGSSPEFDDSEEFQSRIHSDSRLASRVKVFPACSPDTVWTNLCGADIFLFPSHREGMPNSLLEAMAMGIPAVAFAIPPLQEIEAGTGALRLVPPLDERRLGEEIGALAAAPLERERLGRAGREQVMSRFMVRKNVAAAAEMTSRLRARDTRDRREPHRSGGFGQAVR